MHTHSRHATMFAQARREIPCLGTTHADHFHGPVPVTRPLSEQEVAEDYEGRTGRVIVERFRGLDPDAMPAVLVAGHAPFTWGARAPRRRWTIPWPWRPWPKWSWAPGRSTAAAPELEPWVLEKHYQRKHGPAAVLRAVGWVEHGDSIAMVRCAATVSNRGEALPAIRLRASHRFPVGPPPPRRDEFMNNPG